MCGIAGTFAADRRRPETAVLDAMAATLGHRGPDARGVWQGEGIGLAHTRLRVIDLSPGADQPMAGADGALRVVFNGEIYNFQELRGELGADRFRTKSDTEVLLHLYERDGENMVAKLNGMFAFALWDAGKRVLFLARDRAGVKPLVYYWDGRTFAFASEIRALLALPRIRERVKVSSSSLALYFTYGFIPAPYTLYTDIFRLEPAHTLRVAESGDRLDVRKSRYWKLSLDSGPAPTDDEIRGLFEEAVRCRMVADVPVGALLSGGIDSSLCVATIAKTRPILTYTVGFEGAPAFDERPAAREFARRYPQVSYHEVIVRPSEILAEMDGALAHMDEPFGDSSLLPESVICRKLREHVTVAISGDGGDEIFGGYDKYRAAVMADRPWAKAARVLSPFLNWLPEGRSGPWMNRLRQAKKFARFGHLPVTRRQVNWEIGLDEDLATGLLRGMCAESSHMPLRVYEECFNGLPSSDLLNRIMAVDYELSLPGDMLHKVDHASMRFALEIRSPFLDYRLAEAAFQLSGLAKVSLRQNKIVLRRSFADVLGQGREFRRKRGFEIPLGEWFRGPLRKKLWDTLTDPSLSGVFAPAGIERMLKEHQSGRRYHDHRLWILFVYAHFRSRGLPEMVKAEPQSGRALVETQPAPGQAPRKKKLLMITHDFPPVVGGIATHAHGLARNFVRLGWDVLVQMPQEGPFVSTWPGDRFEFAYTRPFKNSILRALSTALGAFRWGRRDSIDAILAVHWRGCGLAAWLASRLSGAPYFVEVHGTDVLRTSMRTWEKRLFGFVQRHSRGCVAGGNYPAGIVRRLGVGDGKLYTMMEGVLTSDREELPATRGAEFRARKGWGERPVLLTVARLEARKGHDKVIEAVCRLRNDFPTLLYVIVGTGDHASVLRDLSRRLGIEDHVRLEGYVKPEEVPLYYVSSDVFVMPNREVGGDVEGFGISFLEAGFYRKPVIGGRSGGAADAVLDGRTGFLVNPFDVEELAEKTQLLLRDPALAQRFGEAGRDRVLQELNYPKIAEGLERFIRSRL